MYDKGYGITALVILALGLMALSFFTKMPIDPVIDKTINSIVSGILGAMVGLPIGVALGKAGDKNQQPPPPTQ